MSSLVMVLVVLFVIQVWFLIVNAISQARLKQLAESTHLIVNSQRTMMLRLIAELTRRIAIENPMDQKAQDAARMAESDALISDGPRRMPI